MATFGQTSIVGYSSSFDQDDRIYANNQTYSPEKDGTADSISLYCAQYLTYTGKVCLALYDSSDSSPGRLPTLP